MQQALQRDVFFYIDLMLDWVANNRPGRGVGWDSYPTSLRIVNWVKWVLSDNAMPDECLELGGAGEVVT